MGQVARVRAAAVPKLPVPEERDDEKASDSWRLTLDMSGGPKAEKRALEPWLDGGIKRLAGRVGRHAFTYVEFSPSGYLWADGSCDRSF